MTRNHRPAGPAFRAARPRPDLVPAMLDLVTGTAGGCSGATRRTFLRVGGLSALGLTLPTYLRARAEAESGGASPPARRAKRCILLWMQGGPSHIDSFDPKPDAPAEVR